MLSICDAPIQYSTRELLRWIVDNCPKQAKSKNKIYSAFRSAKTLPFKSQKKAWSSTVFVALIYWNYALIFFIRMQIDFVNISS